MLPSHGHYVEPFAGSLAVLLAKPAARMETVNDIDGDLMTFWRVLRDQPTELARACALTPHSRAEQEASHGDLSGLGELERARRVWVRITQSRTGTLRRTGWRHHARTEVLWSNHPLRTPDALPLPEFRNTITPGEAERYGTHCQAPGCAKILPRRSTGRPGRFCSTACRMRAHRAQPAS